MSFIDRFSNSFHYNTEEGFNSYSRELSDQIKEILLNFELLSTKQKSSKKYINELENLKLEILSFLNVIKKISSPEYIIFSVSNELMQKCNSQMKLYNFPSFYDYNISCSEDLSCISSNFKLITEFEETSQSFDVDLFDDFDLDLFTELDLTNLDNSFSNTKNKSKSQSFDVDLFDDFDLDLFDDLDLFNELDLTNLDNNFSNTKKINNKSIKLVKKTKKIKCKSIKKKVFKITDIKELINSLDAAIVLYNKIVCPKIEQAIKIKKFLNKKF